jgi:enediyne biosynthesis protein E4
MADVNGDGWLDIYVCRVSGYKGLQGHNELFINNGDLTFTESAKEYGLDFQGFSTQAAFFDFDLDGDLDLYLLNHAVHTQRAYGDASLRHIDDAKAGDRLFISKLNEGDTTFVSVTSKSGIFSSNIGYGLGVGISDLNQDGWPDIYVGNDFNENDYIYLNNKDGTFREASDEMLGHSSRFSMGNDLADINNDGWPEILALDMHPEDETTLKRSAGEDAHEIYTMKLSFGYGWQSAQNTLQLNLKDGTFSEIAQFSGIYATDWSWACLLADFDLDGLKDIYISNGIKRRPNDMDYINFITSDEVKGGLQNNPDLPDMALVEQMPAGDVPDVFYKNNGDLTFQDMSKEWGMNKPSLSNGAAYADLDGDGDLDLVVNRINEPAGIYRNLTKETRNGNHLKLRFEGMGMNTFGIGAKVLAYIGEQVLFYENFNTRGFQSAVEPGLTLGLGKKPRVDSLKVIWPSGICQTIYGVEGNRSLMLKEQEANEQNCRFPHSGSAIFEKSAPFTPFIHQEDNYNDFNLDFLLPHKLSREGPSLAMGHQGDTTYMFFTGAAGQKGELWMHAPHSGPTLLPVPELEVDKSYEDVHAVFFDSNNNGLPDLYVVAGGNLSSSHGLALDRLYINLGNGKFRRSNTHLPKIVSQGAKVVAADWNGDGWQDLFIAARNEVGAYGQSPKSTLLLNRGDGTFRDATTEVGLMDGLLGMLTDALPIDLDKDGKMDLVLCGEWSPCSCIY